MLELNCGLRERSIELAVTVDVPHELLIHSDSELDDFMLS